MKLFLKDEKMSNGLCTWQGSLSVLGWYIAYQQDSDTRDFVHLIMSLSLLPPEVIVELYNWLKSLAATEEAKRLLLYYEQRWINKWTPFAYSQFKRRIRTNNDLEGEWIKDSSVQKIQFGENIFTIFYIVFDKKKVAIAVDKMAQ